MIHSEFSRKLLFRNKGLFVSAQHRGHQGEHTLSGIALNGKHSVYFKDA